MLRRLLVFMALALPVGQSAPLWAQSQLAQPDVAPLTKALNVDALITVMRDEGLANAGKMADDLFAGQGGDAWRAVVAQIYAPAKLRHTFDTALQKSLQDKPETASAIIAFFGAGLGQRIVTLEIDARRALLDEAVARQAGRAFDKLTADKSHRAAQIERFVRVNDLVEMNVMGAMNANLAFYRGMSAAGGFARPMTEDEMVAEVWGQEATVRQDSAEWLYQFLTLAYQPLSDAEFDQYIAYSETPAGQQANVVLFAAFDAVFMQVSKELGQAAARLRAGQDI